LLDDLSGIVGDSVIETLPLWIQRMAMGEGADQFSRIVISTRLF
jgi:hypothetical protein